MRELSTSSLYVNSNGNNNPDHGVGSDCPSCVRDVMRELGAGPRQMVRICGLTYAVVYKIWKDL